MKLKIAGPPKSGRTTLALNLMERFAARGQWVRVRDDNEGLDRVTPGAGPLVEIHTVHRPGEAWCQPGDLPAFVGEDAILVTGPGGRVIVLFPGRPEVFLQCQHPGLRADVVMLALGEWPEPKPPVAYEADPRDETNFYQAQDSTDED